MNLYLDDDCVGKVFVHLLRKAGHDLLLPADIGLAGEDDPVHLGHAIETQRVLLSRNYRDFQNLHELILKARGLWCAPGAGPVS